MPALCALAHCCPPPAFEGVGVGVPCSSGRAVVGVSGLVVGLVGEPGLGKVGVGRVGMEKINRAGKVKKEEKTRPATGNDAKTPHRHTRRKAPMR